MVDIKKKRIPIIGFLLALFIPFIMSATAEEGYIPDFLNFFLEEFFFTTLIIMGISSFIGVKLKSGMAFVGSLMLFILVLTVAGVYPLWMLIIFALLSGAIVYMKVKGG